VLTKNKVTHCYQSYLVINVTVATFFPRWRILDMLDAFWDTYKEYLEVFFIVQNLIGIAAVVLTVQKFEYFAHLA